jgi:transposase
MSQAKLFAGSSDEDPRPKQRAYRGAARVQHPERQQVELRPACLEELLHDKHRARSLWAAVEQLDLTRFYAAIESRDGGAGRPAIDPAILVTLWLYATSEGVGSARELERLCESSDAYRWICGGVSVNHHTLSDFRVAHGAALDELMTQVLGALLHEGLVTLRRVAQDGMRVRASAGAKSFRRERSLKECLVHARQQVREVKRQLASEGGTATRREAAAKVRAAQEREARVRKALAQLAKVRESKDSRTPPAQARTSTTDPDSRVMRMADGGYRPAYNVQLATDTESRVIVGVRVVNRGTDAGQIEPMLEQVQQRTGRLPREHLVDGGYVKLPSIEAAAQQGVEVYAPLPTAKAADIDPREPKRGDGPGVAAWRWRMTSAKGKRIYKERAATAETVNADLKTWRGLDRFGVRGAGKVLCVALWGALAYNLLRLIAVDTVT